MDNKKIQDTLRKQYDALSTLDDEGVDRMIRQSEEFMGGIARLLLEQAGLGSGTTTSFDLVDHACGTGPIAARLQEMIQPDVLRQSRILCADVNQAFVDILTKRVRKLGWINVETKVLDAQDSGIAGGLFNYMTLNFALHIIPEPEAVLREACRVLRPGGTLAFSVVHADTGVAGGWVPDLRSTLETLPFKTPLPSPVQMAVHGKPEWVDPEGIKKALSSHGFVDIVVRTISTPQHVKDPEEFATKFSMIFKWIMDTYWTEEQIAEYQVGFRDRVIDHLTEKHGNSGWDLQGTAILATAKTPQ
ncbi:hypothetical protein V2G26_020079 [Clonostachys chloroleuca]|uniref:Methyltransferase type 11 domain-containing protein n=1 Tax=Clonostachys chloroleuca TaxID=1926264 RepID=A0AA35Q0Y8_9HYPO|nr:unnamed protein product [Clonostachys chloroleuca]